MAGTVSRRNFIQGAGLIGAGVVMGGVSMAALDPKEKLFRISLAEWSVNRMIFGKARELFRKDFNQRMLSDFDSIEKQAELTNLQFPVLARRLGFDAVEYVNHFFFNKAKNKGYLSELKHICKQEGIKSVLIMCGLEGDLGHPDKKEREQTVENHKKWVDAAAFLGCHAIRVNARSSGTFEEQQKLLADGLLQLCEYGDKDKINILVENHGGLSSNPEWTAGIMQMTAHKRVGTLPDFGNFKISETETYDRYRGVELMMPWAKGVSAKSYDFDENGNETQIDYFKMIKIVLDAGYRGYIGVEYEGNRLSETDGIVATRKLLERVRDQYQG